MGAFDDELATLRAGESGDEHRQVRVQWASTIEPRRVRWLWDERIALGSLALLAGREGLGKSLLAYERAARITRGELVGEYEGEPRPVLVCATEDSWAHTIVPRLMGANADRKLIGRIDVVVDDAIHAELSLPRDLPGLEKLAADSGAALLILDPLMSRLDTHLDTHRDGEVRQALEPLVGICERVGMSCWGLIHHNKSGSSDPLDLVMASKAFVAVARSVHTVIIDPDDESRSRRLFGVPKNNLGRSDLAVATFTVESWKYDTDDGPGETGRLVWGTNVMGVTIHDVLARSTRDPEKKTAENDAARWLRGYMDEHARELPEFDGDIGVDAADARAAAEANGHSITTMYRARTRLGITAVKARVPRGKWFWMAPERISRAGGPETQDSTNSWDLPGPPDTQTNKQSKSVSPPAREAVEQTFDLESPW